MASFKRFSSMLLGFSLLAASSVIGGACSVKLSADMGARMTSGNDNNDLAGNAAGAGGSESSGVVLPPPKDQGPVSSFGNLCGGGCMSDDKSLACPAAPEPSLPPSLSCQIVSTENGLAAECLPPGQLQDGDPCEKTSSCAASLGCVRMGSDVGVCRPYCCNNVEACAKGTYCALGAMAEDVLQDNPLSVPVCVPATPCTLLDDTTCKDGLTCTLVRADGTTSCVEPGLGRDGDACPCAAGQVCVISSHTCRGLCHVGGSDCPKGMLCQGGSEGFPDGIGVCVK